MDTIDVDKLVQSYLAKRKYDNDRYHKIKDNQEFKDQNNARAKKWYDANRQRRLDYYDANKQVKCAYQQFNYYKKQDRLSEFVLRFPSKWKLLLLNGKLSDDDKEKGAEHYIPEDPDSDEDPETGEVNPNFVY